MKKHIFTTTIVTTLFDAEEREAFVMQVQEHIEEIQRNGHYAEVHYSVCANNGQYVQSALILEREE